MFANYIRKFSGSTLIVVLICMCCIAIELSNQNNAYGQITSPGDFGPGNAPPQSYSIKFYNVNMPATILVGQDFNVTGVLVASSVITLDHIYLSVESTNELFVYGQKTVDLGYFLNGVDHKNFIFKIRALQPGSTQMTLTADGVQNMNLLVTANTQINTTAVLSLNGTQPTSQLSFINVQIPQNIVTNQPFKIHYSVSNKGGSFTANDVFISVGAPTGLIVKDNPIVMLGNMKPGSTNSSYIALQALQPGSYDLSFTAFSSNNPSITIPITVTVQDQTVKLSVTSLTSAPVNLFPGDIADQISVGITNYGNQDLYGVNVKLVPPKGITPAWTGYDTFTIPYLPSAKYYTSTTQQVATYYISIDPKIQPGNQFLKLLMNEADIQNYPIDVPIVVQPKASFEVESISYSTTSVLGSTQSEGSLSPGTAPTVVRMTLKNIGTAPADSVITQLQISNDLQGIKSSGVTTVGNSDDVGTILPNEEFHSTFLLDVDPTTKTGTYQGSVFVTWQQGDLVGNFKQGLKLSLNVTNSWINQIPYLQIFLGATTGIFILLYIMARKKKKAEESGSVEVKKSSPASPI